LRSAFTGFQFLDHRRVGPEERVLLDDVPIERARHDVADLREIATHADAECFGEPFLGDDGCGDAHRRLARGRAPAAARIADAVFLPVGVVGVAGAKVSTMLP
jgi:hypothetical protein